MSILGAGTLGAAFGTAYLAQKKELWSDNCQQSDPAHIQPCRVNPLAIGGIGGAAAAAFLIPGLVLTISY